MKSNVDETWATLQKYFWIISLIVHTMVVPVMVTKHDNGNYEQSFHRAVWLNLNPRLFNLPAASNRLFVTTLPSFVSVRDPRRIEAEVRQMRVSRKGMNVFIFLVDESESLFVKTNCQIVCHYKEPNWQEESRGLICPPCWAYQLHCLANHKNYTKF